MSRHILLTTTYDNPDATRRHESTPRKATGPDRRLQTLARLSHHRLVVVFPVCPAGEAVRHRAAARPGRVHGPRASGPHGAEPVAAADPARAAPAAPAHAPAALVREHAPHLGGRPAAPSRRGGAVPGARVGVRRVAPAGAVAAARVLRPSGPLDANGGAADDVR